jgi:ferritin-like protein
LTETSNDGYPAPPENEKDFEAIVRKVIEAERGAIEVYNRLSAKAEGKDPITHCLVVHILGEEVEHEDGFESLLGEP